VRLDAVVLLEVSRMTVRDGAALLGLSRWTLRGWRQRHRKGVLGTNLLGRPAYRCTDKTKQEIEDLAEAVGLKVSVRYVRERIGHVPRAVTERVVREHKKELRRQERNNKLRLNWEEPGRVWSCDWTEPDMPVDGVFHQILAVRDLGSSFNIGALPSVGRSAVMACLVMEHLFMVHGAPLVLKTDGGSEFIAHEFKELLASYNVIHLVSPPNYPPYNGAIEAGIGSLKTHTFHEAVRRGRLRTFTCDDVQAGRLIANETSRPWGPKGPSPDSVWKNRTPINREERENFIRSHSENREHYGKLCTKNGTERKKGERRAVEKTLVDAGCLVIKRRRITPEVYEEKRTNLT